MVVRHVFTKRARCAPADDLLETKGHDLLEDIKTQAAKRWVDAVNADGSHGEWRYEIVHEMNAVPAVLDRVAAPDP